MAAAYSTAAVLCNLAFRLC